VTKRLCPRCGTGVSANRSGLPGRCVACIDAHYRVLGLEPCEPHVDSSTPRRCECVGCGSSSTVAYGAIRNSTVYHCGACSSRLSYEQGLAADPARWGISKIQAARMLLSDGFVVRDRTGEIMGAEALAAWMEHVWFPVPAECIECGTTMQWNLRMRLATAHGKDRIACFTCMSLPQAAEQDSLFEAHGLRRDQRAYARYGDKVSAHCLYCGAERLISATDLLRAVTPCLSCAAPVDPDAPHHVYQLHFPALAAFKIGITNAETRRSRTAVHEAHGAIIVEVHETPNWRAAKTVEDHVLRLVRGYPSGCTARDFPQGGYTETWSEDAGAVDLGDIIARLRELRAPGFDRIHDLERYFAQAPPMIDELRDFTRLDVQELDGVEVHCLSLSKSREQILGQIRARRTLRRDAV
jgi:hypothetical protein